MYNWKPVIKSLTNLLEKAGFSPVHVDDGGENVKTSDWSEVIEAVCAVDESNIYVSGPDGKTHWLFIVLGNDPEETVCDYGVYSELDKVVDKFYETWEGKSCPEE